MGKLFKPRKKKVGLSPGVLIYTGEATDEPVKITVIDYDEAEFSKTEVDNIVDVFPFKDKPTKTWINVDGLHDIEKLTKLAAHFDIHSLVMEDVVSVTQRPKFLDMEDYIFVVLKHVTLDDKTKILQSEQISMLIGKNFVITFMEHSSNIFKKIQLRIKKKQSRHRKNKSDYLAYTLIDAVMDNYFNLLEDFGDKVEEIDEKLIENPKPEMLQAIHKIKKEVIYLRNTIWPLREVLNGLEKTDSELLPESTDPYWRDVYDHLVQIIEILSSYRDVISGMLDLYLSVVNNKMNEVMKVLTIIATIFIPLSFMTGLYGMNFKYIPETEFEYGYFLFWGVVVFIVGLMLLYFRKRKWF